MQYVFPDYYKEFACIKGECRHNCCIGWEIDIDGESEGFYQSVSGDFGKRLRDNISEGEPSHFILRENDRCPFLNDDNLCDIIIKLGEEHLCHICDCHPRFINELPGRVETGLGLCCEAAARLILGKIEPSTLEADGKLESDDEIIVLRDKIINALQNREKAISERINDMLSLCGIKMPDTSFSEWADFFLGLERLDEKWTDILTKTKKAYTAADCEGFDRNMESRQTEYEQLLVYFIYRHFANSPDFEEAKVRAAFAALSYIIIYTVSAVTYTENGSFDFEDMCETARLFSSEIEYSEDNLYAVFDELSLQLLN